MFKESFPLVALSGGAVAASALLYGATRWKVFVALGCVAFLSLAFLLYFFRDPERVIPKGAERIVSPADGKVIEIAEIKNTEFIAGPAHKVAIFLSVWNVHVNRIPVDGKVVYLKYRPGAFKRAYLADASEANEQMAVGIESEKGRFLVKQIAGILARRIVCRLKPEDNVSRGGRFGMIKFGSRTELYLPVSVHLRVSVGDRVKGGETIIGELPHEP